MKLLKTQCQNDQKTPQSYQLLRLTLEIYIEKDYSMVCSSSGTIHFFLMIE